MIRPDVDLDLSAPDLVRAAGLGRDALRWASRHSPDALARDLDLSPEEVRDDMRRVADAIERASMVWTLRHARIVYESPTVRAFVCAGGEHE